MAKEQRPLIAIDTQEGQREPRWLLAILFLFAISVALLLLFYVEFEVFLY